MRLLPNVDIYYLNLNSLHLYYLSLSPNLKIIFQTGFWGFGVLGFWLDKVRLG